MDVLIPSVFVFVTGLIYASIFKPKVAEAISPDLPDEIIRIIAHSSDHVTYSTISKTCKRLRRLLVDDIPLAIVNFRTRVHDQQYLFTHPDGLNYGIEVTKSSDNSTTVYRLIHANRKVLSIEINRYTILSYIKGNQVWKWTTAHNNQFTLCFYKRYTNPRDYTEIKTNFFGGYTYYKQIGAGYYLDTSYQIPLTKVMISNECLQEALNIITEHYLLSRLTLP